MKCWRCTIRLHWDFVQIQLNYVDWRHASTGNVNAEYLYAELDKRQIPAISHGTVVGRTFVEECRNISLRV